MRFEFATATRILFGPGRVAELGSIVAGLGRRALLVRGRAEQRALPARTALAAAGVEVAEFAVTGEPTVEDVRRGCAAGRDSAVAVVVSCGGGSAIDAGKAIAALLGNGGDPLDYLEVVGAGLPLELPSLPFVAVPTTAGTGSEVTRNAVLASPQHRVKASLRSPHLLARAAIVDPDLLLGLPPRVTAVSGLDAFAQVLEPFVSARANPLVDALCREGLLRSARSLRRAFTGDDPEPVRVDLALASLFGGLALANAGLGAVHGFAAPVGGMFDAPHGAACAAVLAAAVRVNARALVERQPDGPALQRYREAAAIVTGRSGAAVGDLVAWIEAQVRALQVPGLGRWGARASDVPALVAKARDASSMKGNPIVLSEAELAEIATASL
ncbi:MAG TPA: iron-containing alcohol dehydrogenase [Vicinamibacteria bacterium]|nr:iron-containing alcohol dehydrogenase [Vicinamibacteria bacterium]